MKKYLKYIPEFWGLAPLSLFLIVPRSEINYWVLYSATVIFYLLSVGNHILDTKRKALFKSSDEAHFNNYDSLMALVESRDKLASTLVQEIIYPELGTTSRSKLPDIIMRNEAATLEIKNSFLELKSNYVNL